MMKTIWKYALDFQTIVDIPKGAKVLTVQEQRGDPQLWAIVDPDAETEKRTFIIYGTGHNMPDDPGEYVGTFQQLGGNLVFHVFEYLVR